MLRDSYVCDIDLKTGLCARHSLYSWKILFDHGTENYELIFSASSAMEEKQWKTEIIKCAAEIVERGACGPSAYSFVSLALLPLNMSPQDGPALTRMPSTPSFAATRPRSNSKEVCIRRTNYPNSAEDSISQADGDQQLTRARSVYSRRNPTVLTPRRQDRIRLEKFIADVYTRDVLPFPGMALAKGDILSRTGSLIRRFSLHTGFARRSSSLSTTHTQPIVGETTEEADHHGDDGRPSDGTLGELSMNQERRSSPAREHAIQGAAASPGSKSPHKRASPTHLSVRSSTSAGSTQTGNPWPGLRRKRDVLHAVVFQRRKSSFFKENEA